MSTRHAFAACIAVVVGTVQASGPGDEPPQESPVRYLLGVALRNAPEYDGAQARETKLRPVWAAKIGRVRITTSGGSALLGFGRDGAGAGASTQLIDNAKWRLGVSARIDSGRDSSDASTTQGLPDVRRTLRAKLYASYSLTPDWTVGMSLSQDVLGRHGGLTAGLDTGYRLYRSESTEWTAGVGLTAANATNLRSYFGVPASAAAASGKPVYEPGAGLRDVSAGLGFKHAMTRHWFVFGGAGASRLMGPAADSPLVQKRGSASAQVGVAWRN